MAPSVSMPRAVVCENSWAPCRRGGDRHGMALGATPSRPPLPERIDTAYSVFTTLHLEWTSRDGDQLTIDMQSMERLAAQEAGGEENGVARAIVDELRSMKEALLREFVESLGIEWKDSTSGVEGTAADEEEEIPGLPEYWNAENTSERIVDFALSFASMYEGDADTFASMIKDAVAQGFSMARDILGELPGPVNKLVNRTFDLAMKKIDDWAAAQRSGMETVSA